MKRRLRSETKRLGKPVLERELILQQDPELLYSLPAYQSQQEFIEKDLVVERSKNFTYGTKMLSSFSRMDEGSSDNLERIADIPDAPKSDNFSMPSELEKKNKKNNALVKFRNVLKKSRSRPINNMVLEDKQSNDNGVYILPVFNEPRDDQSEKSIDIEESPNKKRKIFNTWNWDNISPLLHKHVDKIEILLSQIMEQRCDLSNLDESIPPVIKTYLFNCKTNKTPPHASVLRALFSSSTNLSFSSSHLTPDALNTLLQTLNTPNPTITKFSLKNTKISIREFEYLISALPKWNNLKKLDLRRCDVDNQKISSLARLISERPSALSSLEYLDLSHNFLGSCAMSLRVLFKRSRLHFLGLKQCSVSFKDFQVRSFSEIRILQLSGNPLGLFGIDSIFSSIRSRYFFNLCEIDLGETFCLDKEKWEVDLEEVCICLESESFAPLEMINLSRNNFSYPAANRVFKSWEMSGGGRKSRNVWQDNDFILLRI